MKIQKTIIPILITVLIISTISGCIDGPVENQNNKVEIQGKQGSYTIIERALENASNGDTIIVYPGHYKESLRINKSITLKGINRDTTIIDGNYEGDVIYIISDNVNISTLTITNSSNISHDLNAGIDVRSNNNSIINNKIIKNGYYAIYFGNNVKHCTIKNNNISDNKWAIDFNYASENNISHNIISNNSDYGIYLGSQSNSNQIFDNIFSENNYAIRIKGSNINEVVKNTFKNNDRGVYFCCGSRNNIVHHCNFYNGSDYHGRDYLDNSWDDGSQGNYWDDYDGVDENGDGIGDTPYRIGEVYDEPDIFDNYPLMFPI